VSFIAWRLSLTSTGLVRDFSQRNVKISHRMVNPPTKYKQIIISQLPHGEISRYKAKKGCFSSTKANFRIFFRIVKDNLKYRAFYVKYYKNMTFFSEGWQPCFHYTGT
jgi:hypothetical protein